MGIINVKLGDRLWFETNDGLSHLLPGYCTGAYVVEDVRTRDGWPNEREIKLAGEKQWIPGHFFKRILSTDDLPNWATNDLNKPACPWCGELQEAPLYDRNTTILSVDCKKRESTCSRCDKTFIEIAFVHIRYMTEREDTDQ